MSLNNKVAVVTGASAGIGAAIAKELSSVGVKLLITARSGDKLEALKDSLETECITYSANIADADTAEALLAKAKQHFGEVDFLINSAGLMSIGLLEHIDLDVMAEMVQVNFTAVVRSSYTFAREFKKQGKGTIINISSLGATLSTPTMGVYCGSKAALETFSHSLRKELAGTGVKVGVIAPGSTETSMYEDLVASSGGNVQSIEALQASDIASAVRYMLELPQRANIPQMSVYPAEEMF